MRIHVRAWGSALIVSGLAAGVLTGGAAFALSGSEPVADGGLPFVAKVDFGATVAGCTGVLVDSRWIMTHKSCFTDGSAPVVAGAPSKPTSVLVGRTDLTKTTGFRAMVQSIVPHPDRNVVLAELSAPVKGITPVTLGGAAAEVGETLQIAGYGRTATEWVPDRLHAASFTVQSAGTSTFEVVGASGGATLCKGDAGGPVLRSGNVLVGLTDASWQKGCLGSTETRDGAVETRVDDLGGWIRDTVAVQPQGLRDPVTGDFNRDAYQDLLAADSLGNLWMYPGTATYGLYAKRVSVGNGWGGYREFAIGRVNRDQYDDLVTIETASQKLWLYPGTAAGGRFGTRVEIGSGWGAFRDIAIGRVNADAYDDLLTVRDTDSKLFLYKGNATGPRFDEGVEYGSSWNCCAALSLGKFNNDDYDDLVTLEKSTGKMRLYAGKADGTQFVPSVDLGAGATWGNGSFIVAGRFDGSGFDGLLKVDTAGQTTLTPRTSGGGWGTAAAPIGKNETGQPADLTKLSVGELNRDAYPDLMGADSAGALWMHPGTAVGTFGPRVLVGSGWNNGHELVIADATRGDDYDDLIALEISTSKQWLYPGGAAGTVWGTRQEIGSGWTDFRDVAIGKVDRDEFDDLLVVKDGDNKLYLYKGTAAGGRFAAGVGFGTGWDCCTQLTLGNFNGDAYDDLLAIDKATGKLRLYASKADGSQFEASVDPGAGDAWKNRTELVGIQAVAGQHDGLLAKDPSGELLLFPTTSSGAPNWNDPIHYGSRD